MNRTVLIALLGCLLAASCSIWWSPETTFFSNFSVAQLVERNKTVGGLTCDAMGGGGGNGLGSRTGLAAGTSTLIEVIVGLVECRLTTPLTKGVFSQL